MNTRILSDRVACVSADSQRSALPKALLRIVAVVAFALLTALAAQVKLPLPGTPVPVTLQTFVVVLAGITLGPALGTASMALYLLLGAVSYHAFAVTGYGWEAFAGPTAGYLVGFVLAQPVIGGLTRSRRCRWGTLLTALLAGHAVIFAAGLLWLGVWSHAGIAATLAMGLWPFVPGTILKTLAAMPLAGMAGARIRPKLQMDRSAREN